MGYLAQARLARLSLLDSVDKAITIIHLLTNNHWGIERTQFLSCRQGVPSRDKLTSWGDRSKANHISEMSLGVVRDMITSNLSACQIQIDLLASMRSMNYLYELRCTEDGIVARIALLPASNKMFGELYAADLLLSQGTRPPIVVHPIIRRLVDKEQGLVVRINGVSADLEDDELRQVEQESVLDELFRCRVASLDYAIMNAVHEEVSGDRHLPVGWVVTQTSRSIQSLPLILVGPGGHEVYLGIGEVRPHSRNIYSRHLRHTYLDHMATSKDSRVPLLRGLLDQLMLSSS